MTNKSIIVEGLGKRYRLPQERRESTRMSQLLAHWKEFFGELGTLNDNDYFWALKDISFSTNQGEALGIVGMNGSGKSTLLKILTGVTDPTTGHAELKGRVGSLLEVGTGFHPDLTGRENIYLSGALLGMKRSEIRKKFDHIIDFSGIESFIDVPVKRYSSGMYVRLAYAVASQLETDILILDEVLAVGDASFRQKSLDNMERIAHSGRTILFVSHSTGAVSNLCQRALVLHQGQIQFLGTTEDTIAHYMRLVHNIDEPDEDIAVKPPHVDLQQAKRFFDDNDHIFTAVETLDANGIPTRLFKTGDSIIVRMHYKVTQEKQPYFCVFFLTMEGERIMVTHSNHQQELDPINGEGFIDCQINDLRLVNGDYSLMLDYGYIRGEHLKSVDCVPNATQIRISFGNYFKGLPLLNNQGSFAQRSHWQIKKNDSKKPIKD